MCASHPHYRTPVISRMLNHVCCVLWIICYSLSCTYICVFIGVQCQIPGTPLTMYTDEQHNYSAKFNEFIHTHQYYQRKSTKRSTPIGYYLSLYRCEILETSACSNVHFTNTHNLNVKFKIAQSKEEDDTKKYVRIVIVLLGNKQTKTANHRSHFFLSVFLSSQNDSMSRR